MKRIEKLRQKVIELYEAKHPNRADFADWIYESHVFVVAEYARALSDKFDHQNDLAEAAAMLHDCADAVMSRFADEHEEKSMEIARRLLEESDYSKDEIMVIVDDAIANHSCHGSQLPETEVGKIMATADAQAHLCTDFYDDIKRMNASKQPAEEFKAWVREKLDRDFNVKIFFPEIKEELKEIYEKRKTEFGVG